MTISDQLTFRAARPDESAVIAALVNACYRGDASRRGWTTEADLLDGTRTDQAEVAELIEREDSVLLLCLDRDEVIGSVHLRRTGSGGAYLGMLVVRPDLQAKGIGKRLIATAESFVRDAWAAATMTMTVFSVRSELLAYYERRGYHRTGRTEPFTPQGSNGVPLVDGLVFEVLEKRFG